MKFAWLIESENGLYIGVQTKYERSPGFAFLGWIVGWQNAIRFARKEDAEAMIEVCRGQKIGFHEDAKGAVEHGFEE